MGFKQPYGSIRKRAFQPSPPLRLTYFRSEILPLRFRQRGSSISTVSRISRLVNNQSLTAVQASNWIFNYMIVQITPISISNIGWRTYIIFAVLNACWVPIIFLFFPETKGLELEAVDALFSGDAPVEPYEFEKGDGDIDVRVEQVVGKDQARV